LSFNPREIHQLWYQSLASPRPATSLTLQEFHPTQNPNHKPQSLLFSIVPGRNKARSPPATIARPCHSYSMLFHLLKPHRSSMSGTSMTLAERFEALMKQNEFLSRKIKEDAQKNQETRVTNA